MEPVIGVLLALVTVDSDVTWVNSVDVGTVATVAVEPWVLVSVHHHVGEQSLATEVDKLVAGKAQSTSGAEWRVEERLGEWVGDLVLGVVQAGGNEGTSG